MIKAEIDITKPMKSFSYFAENGDINNAVDTIIVISQKTLIKPSAVLNKIIEDAIENEHYKEYDMANQILVLMENAQAQCENKGAEIGAAVDDVKYCLGEIKKSGNPAVIENYIAAVRKDLDQIESVLSNV